MFIGEAFRGYQKRVKEDGVLGGSVRVAQCAILTLHMRVKER